MIWIMLLLVVFVGTPMLLFGLACLANEIGLTLTVTIGFVLLIASSAISMPAMVSMVITGGIVWVVYQMVNRADTEATTRSGES
jgi:hypothetical protein